MNFNCALGCLNLKRIDFGSCLRGQTKNSVDDAGHYSKFFWSCSLGTGNFLPAPINSDYLIFWQILKGLR